MLARTLFLIIVVADGCFPAAVNLYLTNLTLVNAKLGNICASLGPPWSRVACGVLRGQETTLNGTWVVDGSPDSLALTSLKVSWQWSDWKGDTLDKTVCQMAGGSFQFVDSPCSVMIVPSGNYPLQPYKFKMIYPPFPSTKVLTISAKTGWSDKSTKNFVVGQLQVVIF